LGHRLSKHKTTRYARNLMNKKLKVLRIMYRTYENCEISFESEAEGTGQITICIKNIKST